MNLIKTEKNGAICAVVQSSKTVITDAQSALERAIRTAGDVARAGNVVIRMQPEATG